MHDAKGLQRLANDLARPSWPHPLALITREARCRGDLIGTSLKGYLGRTFLRNFATFSIT